MLLSFEEGVKSFSISFSQTGSVLQDIVTANVLRKKANEYAKKFGFEDVSIHLVYHQWMGAFPYDKNQSDTLINIASFIASMIKADKIITKTRDEAFGIPTKEANALAVGNTKYSFKILNGMPKFSDEEEEENLSLMVDSIFEAIFNDKADTLWRQVFNSIKNGIVDVPFSPHVINANEVITLRDSEQNIRLYNKGKLPISQKCFKFERDKLEIKKSDSVVKKIIKDIGIMQ
jgi:methylaspartate mutase epsilon subunit